MFKSLYSFGHFLQQLPKPPKLPLLYFVRRKPFPMRVRVRHVRCAPVTDSFSITEYGTPSLLFSQAMRGLRAYSLVDLDEIVKLRLHMDLFGPNKKKQKISAFNAMVQFPHPVTEDAKVFVLCHPDEVESAQKCGAKGYLDINSLKKLETEIIEEHDFFLSTVTAYDIIRPLLGRVLRGKMPNRKKGSVVEPEQLGETVKKFHSITALSCQRFSDSRTDWFIDVGIGRLSFSDDDLLDNLDTVLDKVREYNTADLEKFVFKANLSTEHSTLFTLSEGQYLRVNSAVADSSGLT